MCIFAGEKIFIQLMVKEIIKMDEKDIRKMVNEALEKRVDEKTDMALTSNNAIDEESLINEIARTNVEEPKDTAISCQDFNVSDITKECMRTKESHVKIFGMVNKRMYRPSDFKKQHFIPDFD